MAGKINISDTWKNLSAIKINIGDTWKEVTAAHINIGDSWKEWWSSYTRTTRLYIVADTAHTTLYELDENFNTIRTATDVGGTSSDLGTFRDGIQIIDNSCYIIFYQSTGTVKIIEYDLDDLSRVRDVSYTGFSTSAGNHAGWLFTTATNDIRKYGKGLIFSGSTTIGSQTAGYAGDTDDDTYIYIGGDFGVKKLLISDLSVVESNTNGYARTYSGIEVVGDYVYIGAKYAPYHLYRLLKSNLTLDATSTTTMGWSTVDIAVDRVNNYIYCVGDNNGRHLYKFDTGMTYYGSSNIFTESKSQVKYSEVYDRLFITPKPLMSYNSDLTYSGTTSLASNYCLGIRET